MLSVEISTIYKKGEVTRKIHHLLYAPDFATADRIAARLARIGNIASDGRPILGLDSRNLLEIALESNPDAYLVPAHIWTPWFAVLGSQSGFDSIVECYGDLANHVFALETGLSSDPPMNWRLSFLDRFRLVSNSDAHSPAKLGRETTLFDSELDYFSLRRALETGKGYVGTVEFFPEEGKYHLDGHRKCGARLTPAETIASGGRCPVCGQSVTIGVLHRVDALADRSEAEAIPPSTAGKVANLVPLAEILSEIAGSGPLSKTVERGYDRLLGALGPELDILQSTPLEEIARAESTLLAEAIARLRTGNVVREAGYDGEYGVIHLFDEAELKRHTVGGVLFDAPRNSSAKPMAIATSAPGASAPRRTGTSVARPKAASGILAELDDDQRAAVTWSAGPLLIVAGPGSGKTRTLTHRIAYLTSAQSMPPAACLAVTFTRRAAAEMKERLARLIPAEAAHVPVHTFHSLGLTILREHANAAGLHRGFRIAGETERLALLSDALHLTGRKANAALRAVSKAKCNQGEGDAEIAATLAAYSEVMAARNWIDFDDLVGLAVRALSADPGLVAHYRERFAAISVDEFQDIDELQYRLLALLAPASANLCVIGDPDQAIYGFRGADASCFDRFRADYAVAGVVTLRRNYRSSGTIVSASAQVLTASREHRPVAQIVRDMEEGITIHAAASDRAEAEFVVQTIEAMIGGHSFFSIDSGRTEGDGAVNLSFSDFAVLYRTDAQSDALSEALARSGMPFKKHSHRLLAEQTAVRTLLSAFAEDDGKTDGVLSVAHWRAVAAQLVERDAEPARIEIALQQLTELASNCAFDPARFADALALATEADFWDARADRVSLLTLHAAKGLEFPVVFITGIEDGILPLRWGERDASAVADERRLLYVGMTRAKDRLFLSRALRRQWQGKMQSLGASPFLEDIESALLRLQQAQVIRRNPADRQLKLF